MFFYKSNNNSSLIGEGFGTSYIRGISFNSFINKKNSKKGPSSKFTNDKIKKTVDTPIINEKIWDLVKSCFDANSPKPITKKRNPVRSLNHFSSTRSDKVRRPIKKFLKNKIKKKWIHPAERHLLKKKNPDQKKYYLFIKKMKNNVFLTVTDIMGRVIVSQSAGSCKITTKKKKRSPETLKAVATSTAKLVRAKNIRYIFRFFNVNPSIKPVRSVLECFSRVGLSVLKYAPILKQPHGMIMRKRKLRRL